MGGTGMRDSVTWWLVGALVATVIMPLPANALESPFSDVSDKNQFLSAIAWMADQGITRGCNPPANDMFCPDAPVTRGQMAAFLTRALSLRDGAGSDRFVDDGTSIFETDIERLAAAGITRGCNPPANNRFCPDAVVTRGQMAAFLVRAFRYSDSGGKTFVDDDGSIFEGDIERLAEAGVTKGCNPPANNRFCPDDPVTRGQMAAFLHRAFGNPLVGEPGVNRVDAETTVVLGASEVPSASVGDDGSATLTVAATSPVPALGRFLIVGAGDAAPTGVLGRVVAVSGRTVETEPVALSQVFSEVEIHESVPLGNLIGTAQGQGFRPQSLFGFNCGFTNVDADIDLGASATINFDAEWGPYRDDYIRLALDLNLEAAAELAGGVQGECSRTLLRGAPLPPVVLPGGLIVQPHFEFGGEVEGAIDAFTIDLGAGLTASTGFEWRNGNTTIIDDFNVDAHFQSSGDYPDSSLETFLGIRLVGTLAGAIALFVETGPSIGFVAQSPTDDPFWEADSALRLAAGLTVNVFILNVKVDIAEVRIGSRVFAAGPYNGDPPPPPPVTTTTTTTTPVPAPGGTMIDLGPPGDGTWSRGEAINSSGQVTGAVHVRFDPRVYAFLWSAETGMINLGTFGGDDSMSMGWAINDSGQVAGWATMVDGNQRAFVWSAETGMIELGTLGGENSWAYAINDTGQVTGRAETEDGRTNAFFWSGETGMIDLGTFGGHESYGGAINSSGQVTGWATTVDGSQRAFVWSPETGMIELGTLSGENSWAYAINDTGQVTGSAETKEGDSHAFFWSGETGMIDLGTFGGKDSQGFAINDSGQVAGSAKTEDQRSYAFFWSTETGMIKLDTFTDGVGWAINNSGQVAGHATMVDGNQRAFVWSAETGMIELGTLGGENSWAYAINDTGQVTGSAETKEGDSHAFLWNPTP